MSIREYIICEMTVSTLFRITKTLSLVKL